MIHLITTYRACAPCQVLGTQVTFGGTVQQEGQTDTGGLTPAPHIHIPQGDYPFHFSGERGPWHPLGTASGAEPRHPPLKGLRRSPTHLPIRDHRTLVTDHSPNLAAFGAGVEVAFSLLLRQLDAESLLGWGAVCGERGLACFLEAPGFWKGGWREARGLGLVD